MSRGNSTNHSSSPLPPASQSLEFQDHHASARYHAQSSTDIWKRFIAFRRGFRETKVNVFEYVEAKMVVKDHHQRQI
ncbi:hypothetical protein G6F53_004723 [Rhizopus delemar]|nr:hypothetical protein G6F53_004723 [Rhizopus delemar]